MKHMKVPSTRISIEDFKAMSKENLKKLLLEASDSYYNQSVPIMTDEEFDIGYKYFISKYPEEYFIGSPINVTNWEKADHKIPMYSLNKVNTVDEFISWANTIGDNNFVIMDKCDGISIDLEYINGTLVKAITRGDGKTGENILNNVLKMKNVKPKLDINFNGSIRGEILMFNNDFEKLNELLRKEQKNELSNPRNASSGISKRYDGKYSEFLTILYYDVTGNWNYEEEKLHWLKQNNLKTCWWVTANIEQCNVYYTEYEKHLRSETPYDIDGLVIKANSIILQKQLGELGGNPKAQIAWKFSSIKAETTIEDIEWSHGQNMRITPIALLNPVRIGGVIVRRASLHNMEMFRALNLGKGDRVLISRRNDVIPYVEKVIEHVANIKFKSPIYCPMCNEELIENDRFLICENTECKGLRLGNLKKWVKALDIDDISDKTIELLEKAGIVLSPVDFYKLDVNVISNLEGMGIRSATKIINNFNAKKEIDLATFIDGLNINNFSKARAKILINNGFNTIEKILSVKESDLIKIKSIGSELANFIVTGLSKKRNTINKLLEVITIKKENNNYNIIEKSSNSSNKLEGKKFCFTGAIERIDKNGKRFTREMMHKLVYENGGLVMDSVKKGLNYLVQVDINSTSSKTKKAKELGVEIISEAEFFKKIEM